MRNRDRAGFLRVVDEVALRVIIRVLADDLDGILVRADRAVRAQAVEQRPHHFRRFDGKLLVHRRDCVWLTSSLMPTVKWFFGFATARLSNTALTIAGVNSLEDKPYRPPTILGGRGNFEVPFAPVSAKAFKHVEIERLAVRARLLGAVQHGDGSAWWRAAPR